MAVSRALLLVPLGCASVLLGCAPVPLAPPRQPLDFEVPLEDAGDAPGLPAHVAPEVPLVLSRRLSSGLEVWVAPRPGARLAHLRFISRRGDDGAYPAGLLEVIVPEAAARCSSVAPAPGSSAAPDEELDAIVDGAAVGYLTVATPEGLPAALRALARCAADGGGLARDAQRGDAAPLGAARAFEEARGLVARRLSVPRRALALQAEAELFDLAGAGRPFLQAGQEARDRLAGVTLEEAARAYRERFVPRDAVLVMAGAVDAGSLALAERAFASFVRERERRPAARTRPATTPVVIERPSADARVTLRYLHRAPAPGSGRRSAFRCLATLAARGLHPAGQLEAVRGPRALLRVARGGPLLEIALTTTPERAPARLDAFFEQLRRLRRDGPGPGERAALRALEAARLRWVLGAPGPLGRWLAGRWLARQSPADAVAQSACPDQALQHAAALFAPGDGLLVLEGRLDFRERFRIERDLLGLRLLRR